VTAYDLAAKKQAAVIPLPKGRAPKRMQVLNVLRKRTSDQQ